MQYYQSSGLVLTLLVLMASSALAASPQPTTGAKPQGSSCPANSPIKGNVRHGQKIYHVPSSPNYQQTKPEACFSSTTAAQQAGFRAPKTSTPAKQQQ